MANGLTTWRPFSDLAELRARFDRLFEEMGDGGRTWTPSIDLIKGDQDVTLKVDLPGIKPDEVEIKVEAGTLSVSGEHSEEHEEHKGRYLRRERRSGSFYRAMPLPEGVNPDDIKAECKDGVLEVHIPVPQQEAKDVVTIKPKAG